MMMHHHEYVAHLQGRIIHLLTNDLSIFEICMSLFSAFGILIKNQNNICHFLRGCISCH